MLFLRCSDYHVEHGRVLVSLVNLKYNYMRYILSVIVLIKELYIKLMLFNDNRYAY